MEKLGKGYNDLFFAGYVEVPALLSNGQETFFLCACDAAYSFVVAGGVGRDSSGGSYWILRVNNNWYTMPSTVQTGQWYFMEIEYNAAGTANLWVNGALVRSASGQSLSSAAQILLGGNPYGATPSGFASFGDDYVAATSYISPM